jgi:hypothetical protein
MMSRLLRFGLACLVMSFSTAFLPSSVTRTVAPRCSLQMAIDYNDPVVAEEFSKVQPMAFEDVEAELRAKGIPVPATVK